ncbi:MAG: TaqI-like C-terminal specificity domain-containing protein, partial [Bacteroidota bacterium]
TYLEWVDKKPVIKHTKDSGYYLGNNEYIIADTEGSASSKKKLFDVVVKTLEEIAVVKNGVQAYTVGEGTPVCTEEMKNKRVYHSNSKKDSNWIKYLDGVDVSRYNLGWSGQFIKYGRNLSRPREAELFVNERILVRQIPSQLPYCIHACFVDEHLVNDNNSMIIKILNDERYNVKYILGVLNSSFISFWFAEEFGKLSRKIFPQFKVKELRTFPFVAAPMKTQKEFEKIVDRIISGREKNKDTSDLEKQIDEMVYELYNLTEEEIKIVEASS